MAGRIVPANFAQLAFNVIPVPNYLWALASNTCSVKPYLFVETMLPATLFLFTRIFLLELEDVTIDATRRAAGAPVGGSKRKTQRGVRNMGPRQKPVRSVAARRFLFFPLGLVERAGFTFLLANFVSELAFTWTSLVAQCDECSDSGSAIALGPMVRSIIPSSFILNDGWEGIPMASLDQNRAGWTSTLQSVTLPPGRWNIVCSATLTKTFGSDNPLQARLRVNSKLLQIPIVSIDDEIEVEFLKGSTIDVILATTVAVQSIQTATVTWEWQIEGAAIDIVSTIDGDVMVTGQSSCAT